MASDAYDPILASDASILSNPINASSTTDVTSFVRLLRLMMLLLLLLASYDVSDDDDDDDDDDAAAILLLMILILMMTNDKMLRSFMIFTSKRLDLSLT